MGESGNKLSNSLSSPPATWSRGLRELVETLCIALILALVIRTFILQAFYIPSSSMEDTLYPRDRILVNKFIYSAGSVERGDVIVFKSPRAPERDFIKRCVGLKGDVVEVRDKVLFINGKPFDNPPGVKFIESSVFPREHHQGRRDNLEPFTIPKKGATVTLDSDAASSYRELIEYEGHTFDTGTDGAIVIDGKPEDSYTFETDHYFMMGDNRDNSQDSRFWKSLPAHYIKGKAIAIYWPLTRIGWIR